MPLRASKVRRQQRGRVPSIVLLPRNCSRRGRGDGASGKRASRVDKGLEPVATRRIGRGSRRENDTASGGGAKHSDGQVQHRYSATKWPRVGERDSGNIAPRHNRRAIPPKHAETSSASVQARCRRRSRLARLEPRRTTPGDRTLGKKSENKMTVQKVRLEVRLVLRVLRRPQQQTARRNGATSSCCAARVAAQAPGRTRASVKA